MQKIKKNENDYDPILYSKIYEEYSIMMQQGEGKEWETDKEYHNTSLSRIENIQGGEQQKHERVFKEIVGSIFISKINVNYPIINDTTYENLKIAPTKFYGCNPNEVGNLCIVGHNNRNKQQFSQLQHLENGDIVTVAGTDGNYTSYQVFEKAVIEPTDLSCTSQETEGKKMVTLITCTNDSKKRLIVKCKEIL